MTKPLIVGLGGTMREISYSRLGLEVALKYAEAEGAETHLLDLQTLDLPMYRPDVEISVFPTVVTEFIDLHRRADGFIWSSPSYHGTITGVFKNAIDFLEFLEDDARPYLTGRPVGVIAANDVPPIDAMRTIARELRAWVSPSWVVLRKADFSLDKSLHNENVLRRLKRVAHEVVDFAMMMQARK